VDRPPGGSAFDDLASGQNWLERELSNLVAVAEAATADGEWSVAPALSSLLGRLLINQYRHHEGLAIHTPALQAARAAGDRPGEANALAYLGASWGQRWELVRAQHHLEPAVELARAAGHRVAEAQAARLLALIHWFRGNHTKADALAATALESCIDSGDAFGEATLRTNRGVFRWHQGRLTEALADFSEALAVLDAAGDVRGRDAARIGALTSLSELHNRQGRGDEAVTCAEQALALAVVSRDQVGEGVALLELGSVRLAQGRSDLAADCLLRAFGLLHKAHPRAEHYAEYWLGELRLRQGRSAEAVDLYERALAFFRTASGPGDHAVALNGLARARLARCEFGAARSLSVSAIELATEAGWPYEVATAHATLGHVCAGLGSFTGSRGHLQRALALYDQLGVPDADEIRALLPSRLSTVDSGIRGGASRGRLGRTPRQRPRTG
jgi:tetratricopeptide (TPR) repeat protein